LLRKTARAWSGYCGIAPAVCLCAAAQMGEGVEVAPNWDEVAQPAPDFEADQRISW
jgi:hypothetical protein